MKTVKKEIKITLDNVRVENHSCMGHFPKYTYEFTTVNRIMNPETITAFVEVEVPETLKEFCNKKDIPKKELVKWLNENF